MRGGPRDRGEPHSASNLIRYYGPRSGCLGAEASSTRSGVRGFSQRMIRGLALDRSAPLFGRAWERPGYGGAWRPRNRESGTGTGLGAPKAHYPPNAAMNSQSADWSGLELHVRSTHSRSGHGWSRFTDHIDNIPIPLASANARSCAASSR